MSKVSKEQPPAEKARRIKTPGAIYGWPMGAWFTLFFVVPLLLIIFYSFLKRDVYGGIKLQFTLKAYKQMLAPSYGILFLRTLKISIISTLITILIALPCGYAIARSKKQTLLLLLVIIPFWTNSLIRIFAWMSILGNNGIINQFLQALHITKDYIKLLYTENAIIVVSIYMYLPYAILPIFTSIDRFDFSLLEAARDLGATKSESMTKVLLPSVRSGVITAVIFTFIPIFGAYTVPSLVGDMKSYMIGNIIVDQVTKIRNWPLAAAFSLVITLLSMAGIILMMCSNKRDANLKEGVKK